MDICFIDLQRRGAPLTARSRGKRLYIFESCCGWQKPFVLSTMAGELACSSLTVSHHIDSTSARPLGGDTTPPPPYFSTLFSQLRFSVIAALARRPRHRFRLSTSKGFAEEGRVDSKHKAWLERMRRTVWERLHMDDACVVSRPPRPTHEHTDCDSCSLLGMQTNGIEGQDRDYAPVVNV